MKFDWKSDRRLIKLQGMAKRIGIAVLGIWGLALFLLGVIDSDRHPLLWAVLAVVLLTSVLALHGLATREKTEMKRKSAGQKQLDR